MGNASDRHDTGWNDTAWNTGVLNIIARVSSRFVAIAGRLRNLLAGGGGRNNGLIWNAHGAGQTSP